jgi:hypothetical protein
MNEAIIEALRKRGKGVADAYMEYVGNPARQLVGGGVRGYFGLDAPEYADAIGMDAYRNAAAASNVPGVGAPAGAFKAMAAAPLIAKALRAAPRDEALETARKNAVKMLGLPENNTPMDRAKAMGFDSDAFHATTKDFSAFDPSKSSSAAAFGPGVYVTYDPAKVSGWSKSSEGANVMPLVVRRDDILPTQLNEKDAEKLSKFLGRAISKENPPPLLSLERRGGTVSEGAKAAGFTGVDHYGPGGHGLNTVYTDPSRIRSRFAAFDPARVNENDLLGRADPKLLAALAAGTTTAATVSALRNKSEEEKKKKREEK